MARTKARHTPKPWWVVVHDKVTSVESKDFTITNDISNDDAHLVAAAPDLLEALRKVRIELASLKRPDLWEIADAAIAKAEGK
jgi:hypothetical protein